MVFGGEFAVSGIFFFFYILSYRVLNLNKGHTVYRASFAYQLLLVLKMCEGFYENQKNYFVV